MQWHWLSISCLANSFLALIIGAFVLSKNRKAEQNLSFAAMCVFFAAWAFFFFLCVGTYKQATSLFAARAMNLSAIFIPVTFLHWVLAALGETGRRKMLLRVCYLINLTLFLLSLVLPEFFVGFVEKKLSYLPGVFMTSGPGFIYHFFTFLFFLYPVYSMVLLFQAWKNLAGNKGRQMRILMIAAIVGFIGGGSSFLPVYNVDMPTYGVALTGLWMLILAYGIIRYRAFEIDTVIHRTILWIFTSALVFIPIGILLYFTRQWLNRLGFLPLTAVVTVLFFLYVYYYNTVQPRIDFLFRRRRFSYHNLLAGLAGKLMVIMNLAELAEKYLEEVSGALFLRNCQLYILDKSGDFRLLALMPERERDIMEINAKGPENPAGGDPAVPVLQGKVSFIQWMLLNQEILEKEQVEMNPAFEKIRRETLEWMGQNGLELLVPIMFQNRVNALLCLGKRENLQSYRMKDLQVLKKLGQETGVIIYNALHYQSLVEVERLEEEMKTGRQIQLALLPQEVPVVKGLSIRGFMQPAKEIGGDYYDFMALPGPEQLGIVIGDVSGKGIAAGLLMAMVKSAIHIFTQKGTEPKELLKQVNQLLSRYLKGDKFMTLLYLVWQAERSRIRYSSAGHEHILLYHSQNGEVEAIPSGGILLGIMPDVDSYISEKEIKVQPGDKVLLYTDGVTEAHNEAKDRFGLDRLKSSFLANIAQPVPELLRAVRDDVYAFIGGAAQYDDVTLVVLEVV